MKYSTSPYGNGQFLGDLSEVERALNLFIDPEHSFEIRSIFPGGGHPCVCRTIEEGLEAVRDAGNPKAIFWILNPVEDGCRAATKKTVLHRRWMLIDVDPVRSVDEASTDEEKLKAQLVAVAICDHLLSLGWPSPIMTDSGNGWHLLYRIDLPNDQLTHQAIKAALIALAAKFDSPDAHVDKSTHDAPRPCKLPGTWARKGSNAPERPHRMAKLVYEPDSIEVVTFKQIQELGGKQPDPEPYKSNGSIKWSQYGGECSRYLRSAIERECFRAALAPEGARNDALNRAAFSLGTMAAWPEMDEAEARSMLIRAGERAGLDTRECLLTVASGWESGRKEPRPRPINHENNGRAQADPAMRLTIGLDEVEPEETEWLWKNVLAAGFITAFAGRTGLGKSMVLCDVVARFSRGEPAPYCSLKNGVIRTLIISEDPIAQMIAPRLLEAKAVPSQVGFMTWDAMGLFTIDNVEMLNRAYEERGRPRLIIVDPPSNFLGKTDEHRNAEVRQAVKSLVAWLDTNKVACVFVTHMNKATGQGLDAVERMMGSVAWGSVCRVTMAFAKNPDDPSIMVCGGTKCNIGTEMEPLEYKVEKSGISAKVTWIGKSEVTMEDAINKIKRKSKGQNAVEWLIGIFRQRREWESEEIRRMAREVGVTKYALFESPEVLALPIQKRKRANANGEAYWVWMAEPNWPPGISDSSESCDANADTEKSSKIPISDNEDRDLRPY